MGEQHGPRNNTMRTTSTIIFIAIALSINAYAQEDVVPEDDFDSTPQPLEFSAEDLAAVQTAAKKAKKASEPTFVQEGDETTDFSMDKTKMNGWPRWRPHAVSKAHGKAKKKAKVALKKLKHHAHKVLAKVLKAKSLHHAKKLQKKLKKKHLKKIPKHLKMKLKKKWKKPIKAVKKAESMLQSKSKSKSQSGAGWLGRRRRRWKSWFRV